MTAIIDFLPILTRNLRQLPLDQWREGDVVTFHVPAVDDVPDRIGYAILASPTEALLFDPYDENAHGEATPFGEGMQLWYHSTLPVSVDELELQDVLSILWHAHRDATTGLADMLIEQEIPNAQPGDVILWERVDGYLAVEVYGQERPYPEPTPKLSRFKWVNRRRKKQKLRQLVTRPYTQRNLLRPVLVSA